MSKKLVSYFFIFLLTSGASLSALSPIGMLEEGKKSFEFARWKESCEILERFMETWPEHEKYNEALYFYTLASARTIDLKVNEYKESLSKELAQNIASLSESIPNIDITEAKVALTIAKSPDKPEIWKDLAKLSPTELKHYISRKWHPDPVKTPFETLKWVKTWLLNHPIIDSELRSEIALIKLSALWEIMRSPLVKTNNSELLEKVGCFPIDKAFKEGLHEAFKKGNLEQKRRAAVFGYHFDYFCVNHINTNKNIGSSWLRYLRSRGISEKDTWSPK